MAPNHTPEGQPLIPDADYEKTYPAGATWGWPDFVPIAPNTPILDIVNSDGEIVHSDLTAIIAGPNNWQFPGRPQNSAEPVVASRSANSPSSITTTFWRPRRTRCKPPRPS